MLIFRNSIFRGFISLFFLLGLNALSYSAIHHGGVLAQDETWSADEVHYIDSTLTVNSGITLSIESGAVIKFSHNTYLQVNGVLDARGTSQAPITFTSYRDDSTGTDDNGDGVSYAQAGDWYGIRYAGSIIDSLNYLEYANVVYASGESGNAAIYLDNASPRLNHVNVLHSQYIGLYAYGSGVNASLTNLTIKESGTEGIHLRDSSQLTITDSYVSGAQTHGVYVNRSAKVIIDNSEIVDNKKWGILFAAAYSGSSMTNSKVTGNDRGVYIPTDMLPNPQDQNVLLPNDQNAIWVRAGARSADLTLFTHASVAAPNQSINTYYISGDWNQSGGTLTIEPGVNLKFTASSSLTINAATLLAQGTQENPITLTSLYDDSVGGDLGRNDAPLFPKAGSWEGLRLNTTVSPSSVIEYVNIRYRNVGMLRFFKYSVAVFIGQWNVLTSL